MKSSIQEKIYKAVEFVKLTNPMAVSITNSVTIEFVANAQLAVGGSAAMVYLPDIARQLFGVSHERMLPISMLLGGLFMLIIDTLARTLTAAEIPIGILTALVGAPFFAYIFIGMKGDS
ncbi:MAG: iron chelate uptake ABC transporter family permease subunit [Peptoniphilaceae bacterium]